MSKRRIDEAARDRALRLARAIGEAGLLPGEPHPCSYLPGRTARTAVLLAARYEPGLYQGLMDLNFRRSGLIFYRPTCDPCRECRAIRVPVAAFRPSRAQRRCWARNRDLSVSVARPVPTAEKHALYARYLESRHDGQMEGTWDDFCSFLYASSVKTLEVTYRLGERLVGAGIVDEEPEALSTVYCYFDPDEKRRGLGVFNVLWTIEHARARGIAHVYLGFYVAESAKMNYKAGYRPHEIRDDSGRWRAG